MFRVAFDPALPLVASQPFKAKGEEFAAGAPVDWRRLGIDEQTVREWWRCCVVSHPSQAQVSANATSEVTIETAGSTNAELAAAVEKRERKARGRASR